MELISQNQRQNASIQKVVYLDISLQIASNDKGFAI